jgi:hypothetical protein
VLSPLSSLKETEVKIGIWRSIDVPHPLGGGLSGRECAGPIGPHVSDGASPVLLFSRPMRAPSDPSLRRGEPGDGYPHGEQHAKSETAAAR